MALVRGWFQIHPRFQQERFPNQPSWAAESAVAPSGIVPKPAEVAVGPHGSDLVKINVSGGQAFSNKEGC